MSIREERDELEAFQDHAVGVAKQVADLTRGAVDRRAFLYFSLVSAAASRLGVQGSLSRTSSLAGLQQPSLPPLGNAEPPSWTFQPSPGGTGALMERLIKEHGTDAFQRSAFTAQRWTGPTPKSYELIIL